MGEFYLFGVPVGHQDVGLGVGVDFGPHEHCRHFEDLHNVHGLALRVSDFELLDLDPLLLQSPVVVVVEVPIFYYPLYGFPPLLGTGFGLE